MRTGNIQIRLRISKFCIYCSSYLQYLQIFIVICFIPRYTYNFRYLVSFNFRVYDIIYIYIKNIREGKRGQKAWGKIFHRRIVVRLIPDKNCLIFSYIRQEVLTLHKKVRVWRLHKIEKWKKMNKERNVRVRSYRKRSKGKVDHSRVKSRGPKDNIKSS